MNTGIYFVKDDVVGEFNIFGMFAKPNIAIRSFRTATNHEDIPFNDLSLYHCGNFDTETGTITPINPEFICRGEKIDI